MNVVQSSRPVRLGGETPSNKTSTTRQHVDFYHDIPSFELSLDEFEEYALARLKVLRKLEELKVRNVTGTNFSQQMNDVLSKTSLNKDKRLDVASHFILRAAYCRTEELRRWFLQQETALFRHRLEGLSSLEHLVKHLDLKPVSNETKQELRESLLNAGGVSVADFSATPYYAISFHQALDLISKRACFVKKGMAYVPLSKLVSILSNSFRMALSQSLTLGAAAFGNVPQEAARMEPLLKTMNSQYTGTKTPDTWSGGDAVLTAATVDSFTKSMPLCMSQLHAGLNQDHKLKHWGRLQYGLFLKGAGLTMEDSLLFFQRKFSNLTPENFTKQYAYNIRHMYGKEGKRASYTPYPCLKIIVGNAPAAGDHHGCPYRHYDDGHLAGLLQNLSIKDRNDILALKKSHNYQLACVKHFEVLHPKAASVPGIELDNVGNHPNAWFAASVSYHSKKQAAAEKAGEKKEG